MPESAKKSVNARLVNSPPLSERNIFSFFPDWRSA
jgi:hypothetical protein